MLRVDSDGPDAPRPAAGPFGAPPHLGTGDGGAALYPRDGDVGAALTTEALRAKRVEALERQAAASQQARVALRDAPEID